MSSSLHLRSTQLGFLNSLNQFSPFHTKTRKNPYNFMFLRSQFRKNKFKLRRKFVVIKAMDEFSDGFSDFDEREWEDRGDEFSGANSNSYILSSSGEESDTDVVFNPREVDLPSTNERFDTADGALAVTAHRMAMLRTHGKINRIRPGNIINMGLILFLMMLLLLVDWCSWRVVRLPLPPFYLSRPFVISALLTSVTGYLCIPIFKSLRIRQIKKKEPNTSKKGTATMGGLYFIPIGVCVAIYIAGVSSVEVLGAAAATLAFAVIGLFDDFYGFINNRNHGLPVWIKILLEVAFGTWFSFWLDTANISTPYSMYTFL
ncbi:phospho-N-acetylmuramoyl-pentapeptide-transferase [Ranunculus cassubicifolius]